VPDVLCQETALCALKQCAPQRRRTVLLHRMSSGLHETALRAKCTEVQGLRCGANERRRAAIRHIIREAKDQPCSDCGVRNPAYVMDFDHRHGGHKRFNIGRDALRGRCSEEALRQEIEKRDVVCANCHRMRTHRRDGELGRQDSNLD
jgi:hypothetical protein